MIVFGKLEVHVALFQFRKGLSVNAINNKITHALHYAVADFSLTETDHLLPTER